MLTQFKGHSKPRPNSGNVCFYNIHMKFEQQFLKIIPLKCDHPGQNLAFHSIIDIVERLKNLVVFFISMSIVDDVPVVSYCFRIKAVIFQEIQKRWFGKVCISGCTIKWAFQFLVCGMGSNVWPKKKKRDTEEIKNHCRVSLRQLPAPVSVWTRTYKKSH